MLERLKAEIVACTRTVPNSPSGALLPPLPASRSRPATVTFDGTTCNHDGQIWLAPGDVVHVEFVDTSRRDAYFFSAGQPASASPRSPPRRAAVTRATSSSRWAPMASGCFHQPAEDIIDVPGPTIEVLASDESST